MHLESPAYTPKSRLKQWLDWLFKDMNGRGGAYVIAEVPNIPQLVFMISIILAVVSYPGFWQTSFALIGYVALLYWGYLEIRSGRSRFRKLLGYIGTVAAAAAFGLQLGF